MKYKHITLYNHPLSDPYIKVYLLHGGKRVSKWKSSIKKRTLIPVFNESFTFDISTLEVTDLSLQVLFTEL